MTDRSNPGAAVVRLLESCREREKEQTLFYRGLAAAAEGADDPALVDRLNDLHADEQHHLSRLTARILELGDTPADLQRRPEGVPPLDGWEAEAQVREEAEVAWYESVLEHALDDTTRAVLEEILAGERQQVNHLSGKWMSA